MNYIFAIATNTFKEAVRNRILYVILFFSLIMIGASGVVSDLTIAERGRIIKDLGFMAINLFGIAIAVLVGVSLVFNELDKRTIYTIVSKPISRWQFLLGKYFGLLMTIYVNVLIMTIMFLFILHYYAAIEGGEEITWIVIVVTSVFKALVNLVWWGGFEATRNVMPVILATVIELAMVTSFAILFSSFTTPFLSMIFTVLTFVAGRLNEDIVLFADSLRDQVTRTGENLPISYYLSQGASLIMPNLQLFHGAVEQALYSDEVVIWGQSIIYAFTYSTGILCLAILIFWRRNFK